MMYFIPIISEDDFRFFTNTIIKEIETIMLALLMSMPAMGMPGMSTLGMGMTGMGTAWHGLYLKTYVNTSNKY